MARRKKKEQAVIERLLKKADEAKKTGMELSKIAAQQAQIHGMRIKKEGTKKIGEGISAAKKLTSSSEEDLKTLEKLAKLKKAGIITDKEFQTKKKQILSRI